MRRCFNKKIGLIGICLIIIMCIIGYYIWLVSEPLDEFSSQICNLTREELLENTAAKEYVELFNKNSQKEILNNSHQVRVRAQKIANQLYDGCSNQRPYIIKYIDSKNYWIIQGNSRIYENRNVLGGVMYLILDKDSGDILYVAHTA